MKEKIKSFAWGYVILFAILTAIGILCIAFHTTLPYVALGIGIVITVYGIGYGIFTIASKDRGPKFAFRITVAICAVIAGVITMVFCKKAINVLTALIGLFLIIDGSFKLQNAAVSKRFKSVLWWVLLVPAVLAIIGGFFITRYESDGTDNSVAVVSVLLGITLIIDAISNLLTAFFSKKIMYAESPKALPEASDKPDSPTPDAPDTSDAPTPDEPDTSDAPADAPVFDAGGEDTPAPAADTPSDSSDTADEWEKPDTAASGSDEFKLEIPAIEIPDGN